MIDEGNNNSDEVEDDAAQLLLGCAEEEGADVGDQAVTMEEEVEGDAEGDADVSESRDESEVMQVPNAMGAVPLAAEDAAVDETKKELTKAQKLVSLLQSELQLEKCNRMQVEGELEAERKKTADALNVIRSLEVDLKKERDGREAAESTLRNVVTEMRECIVLFVCVL